MYEELSESSKQGPGREWSGAGGSTSQIKIKSNKLCDMKRSSNTRVRLPFDWGAATSHVERGGERELPHCIQCVEILGMLSVHDKRLDADVAVLFRRSMLQK